MASVWFGRERVLEQLRKKQEALARTAEKIKEAAKSAAGYYDILQDVPTAGWKASKFRKYCDNYARLRRILAVMEPDGRVLLDEEDIEFLEFPEINDDVGPVPPRGPKRRILDSEVRTPGSDGPAS